MWNYEKRLQYPVNIKNPNGKIAQIIMSQYGGPDGEIGASMRYLSQRFTMPNRKIMGILNDIGTEDSVPPCCHLVYTLSTFLRYTQPAPLFSLPNPFFSSVISYLPGCKNVLAAL